eukprot:3040459-Alexandrium_andersonii.AAC.1
MSASLVGSEMCIRDRVVPKREFATFTSHGRACVGTFSRGTHAQLPPVSYTHLTLPTICSV